MAVETEPLGNPRSGTLGNPQRGEEGRLAKFERMTGAPVRPLIMRLAVPTIVSMLVSALYNTADTYFVSRIDTQASAAVGIAFSYMSFIQALSFFYGQGSSTYIARALGARDFKNASCVAATGFFSVLLTGAAIAAAGLLYLDPLLYLLGSTETILPQARDYLRWILVGTPFIMSSFMMNNLLRFQGNASMAMIGIASGAVLNVALDPIMIFGMGLGTEGASLATMISQIVGFSILFAMTGRRDCIPIKLSNFRPKLEHYREICAGGTPSLARQGLASIGVACLNRAAGAYGDAAVAAFSVANRCTMLSTSVIIGFGQGYQPVCGFNLGARKFGRVREGFRFCAAVMTCYCIVMASSAFAFASEIISLFRPEDAELVRIGAFALRQQCMAYPLVGFIMISNMYLQVARMTVRASIVAMSRQCLVFLPVLYIGRCLFGLDGIMSTQAVSDVITFVIAVILTVPALKNMEKHPAYGLAPGADEAA